MKKIHSIKGRKKLSKVFARGKRVRGKGLRIIILSKIVNGESFPQEMCKTQPNESKVEIGITIHKKFGNAVIRNKTKRQIRSMCRELLPELKLGYYIVIQPDEYYKTRTYSELSKELFRLFSKAGVLSK